MKVKNIRSFSEVLSEEKKFDQQKYRRRYFFVLGAGRRVHVARSRVASRRRRFKKRRLEKLGVVTDEATLTLFLNAAKDDSRVFRETHQSTNEV